MTTPKILGIITNVQGDGVTDGDPRHHRKAGRVTPHPGWCQPDMVMVEAEGKIVALADMGVYNASRLITDCALCALFMPPAELAMYALYTPDNLPTILYPYAVASKL